MAVNWAIASAVIGLFCSFIIVGLVFRKKARDWKPFLIGKKDAIWFVIGLALIADMIGSSTYFAFPKQGITMGFGAVFLMLWIGTGLSQILTMVFAFRGGIARLRRVSIFSLFEDRYNLKTRLATSGITVLFAMGGAGYTILGVSFVMSMAFGLDLMTGVLVALLVIAVYTTISGFYGAVWTDFIEQWLIMGSLLMVFAVGLSAVGGWSNFVSSPYINPAKHFNWISPATVWFTFGLAIAYVLTDFTDPHIWEKTFSLKNMKDGVKALSTWTVFLPIFYAMAIMTGLFGLVAFSGTLPQGGTNVMFNLTETYLPYPFLVFLVVAVLAVVLSSTDSKALVGTTCVMGDFYSRLRKGASEKELSIAARFSVLAILLVGGLLALLYKSIIDLMLFAFSVIASACAIPMLGGVYWSRATSKGALSGVITGSTSCILWEFLVYLPGLTPITSVYIGTTVCFIAFISVSLLTKPEYDKALKLARILGRDRAAEKIATKAGLKLKKLTQEEIERYDIVENLNYEERKKLFPTRLIITLTAILLGEALVLFALMHP